MPDDKPFNIDPSMPVTELLKQLRLARAKGIGELAESTGLSRLTVSAIESQKSDARISSLSALFDKLGYVLLPVPKNMAREVANFVNNGGVSVSLPAGQAAPMGVGQRAFHQSDQARGAYLKRPLDEKSTRVKLGVPAIEIIRKAGTGPAFGSKAGSRNDTSVVRESTQQTPHIGDVAQRVGVKLKAKGGK